VGTLTTRPLAGCLEPFSEFSQGEIRLLCQPLLQQGAICGVDSPMGSWTAPPRNQFTAAANPSQQTFHKGQADAKELRYRPLRLASTFTGLQHFLTQIQRVWRGHDRFNTLLT